MNRFSRTALAFGLALSLAPLAQAADLPDARSLIDAHVAAAGGREALTRAAEGTNRIQMEIVENGMKLEMTMYAREQDRASVMTIPGVGDFRSGFSGGVAWGMDPMNGPRLLQGKEREQAVEQSDIRYSLYDASVIASARTVGLSESEGRPCYRVEIKWVSGRDSAICFGTADGLMVSNESTVVSAMGEIKQVTHIAEYRDFGPVKMSTKATSKAAGMTQVLTLLAYDPALPSPELFALPPAIQALVKKADDATATGNEAKSRD